MVALAVAVGVEPWFTDAAVASPELPAVADALQ
jgi:hypothetical protein